MNFLFMSMLTGTMRIQVGAQQLDAKLSFNLREKLKNTIAGLAMEHIVFDVGVNFTRE